MSTTKKSTITVRGFKVSNRSQRRYIAVAMRQWAVHTEQGTYVAFARVDKRSDNIDTIRAHARRYNSQQHMNGAFCVVVDTTTGEEI